MQNRYLVNGITNVQTNLNFNYSRQTNPWTVKQQKKQSNFEQILQEMKKKYN